MNMPFILVCAAMGAGLFFFFKGSQGGKTKTSRSSRGSGGRAGRPGMGSRSNTRVRTRRSGGVWEDASIHRGKMTKGRGRNRVRKLYGQREREIYAENREGVFARDHENEHVTPGDIAHLSSDVQYGGAPGYWEEEELLMRWEEEEWLDRWEDEGRVKLHYDEMDEGRWDEMGPEPQWHEEIGND
jgi:hypothetical protein